MPGGIEISRILSHLLNVTTQAMDVGALTMLDRLVVDQSQRA
jgi:NADH:ubiquinone oxidoreductase subunit D